MVPHLAPDVITLHLTVVRDSAERVSHIKSGGRRFLVAGVSARVSQCFQDVYFYTQSYNQTPRRQSTENRAVLTLRPIIENLHSLDARCSEFHRYLSLLHCGTSVSHISCYTCAHPSGRRTVLALYIACNIRCSSAGRSPNHWLHT